MRLLLWYCSRFGWKPVKKTLEGAADGQPGEVQDAVVAFIHVEPGDEERAGKVRLVLTHRRLETSDVLLSVSSGWHSHLNLLAIR